MTIPPSLLGRARSLCGCLCVLAWSSACTDPSYSPDSDASQTCRDCVVDAGHATPDGASPDASFSSRMSDPDAALSDALAPLLGSYAMRIRFFGQDSALGSFANFSHEKLGLARVVREVSSGAVQLELKVCADTFKLQIAGLSDLFGATQYPERLPTTMFTIDGDPTSFRFESAPRLLGYHADAPSGCTAGQRVRASSDQVWLGDGQCDCPSSQAAPTLVSDCRVDDPDQDQQPGLTVQLTGSGGGADYTRVRDQSVLSRGVVAKDGRHTGLWLENTDLYQLECTAGPCPRSGYRVCKTDVNPVSFAPIADLGSDSASWDCAAIVPRIDSGELLPSQALSFPSDC